MMEHGVLFYRVKEPQKLLNWAIFHGYLLHGSTRKIYDELVPYQANDKVKESGNRRAVYITKVPVVAMFCAVTGGVPGLERRHNSHTTILNNKFSYENMYFGISDPNLVTEKGYIYILGQHQADEEINGEYLAYKPIEPLAIIEIERKDFPYEMDVF